MLEHVEGRTLADAMRAGPFSVDRATRIARQIACALGAAHDKGVVHRDVKPAT